MGKVLIGCEFSGTVRRAFSQRGHDVTSVDLLPAEDRSNCHIIGDVRDVMRSDYWDLVLMIRISPTCQHNYGGWCDGK